MLTLSANSIWTRNSVPNPNWPGSVKL